MLPDLVSLMLFARVAELRSITRAAETSHIALAAASRRLSLLEHHLGVKLLERSSRGAELTPAGRVALYHVRRVLGQINEMQTELSEHAKGHRGHVRLQANQSAIAQFLADDLAGFAAKVPGVSIALEERPSGEILEGLREGATDVGVVLEGAPMDGLQAFEYATDQLVAILPRAHALKDKRVPFSTLLDHDFVGLDAGNAISRLLQDQAAVAHKPLRLRVQVRSFAALCKMVSAGMGIGILPEGAAKPMLTALRLRMVQLTDVWATRRMYVCVRNYDLLPTVAKSLVDTLTHDRRGGEVGVPRQ